MVEDINLFKISKYSKIFISLFPVVPNTNIILASILLKVTCLTIENVFSFFFNVFISFNLCVIFLLHNNYILKKRVAIACFCPSVSHPTQSFVSSCLLVSGRIAPFSIFCSGGLAMSNSVSICMCRKGFIFSYLRNNFAGYINLGWLLLSFNT